jgi:uncharacterized membrane protein required for colicin V production
VSGFNLLDVIFFAIIVLGGLNGYRLGFVRQVMRLFGVVIAYLVAYLLRPHVAVIIRGMHLFSNTVGQQKGLASLLFGDLSGAIAFVVVFIVVFLLLRYAVGLVDALFRLPVLSFVNRFVGLVLGVAFALIFVYILSLILHYVNTPNIQQQVSHSRIAEWLNGVSWTKIKY